MARQGRELELLIQKLEKMVLPEGATIKSPAFINDKITNQPREVDILIEYKVGTSNLKIVIECRDRIATQDTTWIEQMGSKIRDLNVNKAIAVSSSPFSKPAKEKAKFYGIETRTFSEVSPETIAEWWLVEYVQAYSQNCELIAAEIGLESELEFKESIPEISTSEKVLFRKTDNQFFSILEAIPLDKIDVRSIYNENESPLPVVLNCNYEDPNDRFHIKLHDKDFQVISILFHLNITIFKRSLPTSKIAKYETEGTTISHIVEFDGINMNGNNTLQFIKNQDGSISLSFKK